MQVKSIKWTLLATAALASLAFALTIQQQNVAAFNDRNNQFVYNTQNHLQISEDHGIASNSVNVLNDDDRHYNDNFNSHRDETLKVNEIDKPDNN
jgi:hypothetical protein